MYIEEVKKQINNKIQVEVRENGRKVMALRFTNDITLCTEKEEDLQILLRY